MTCGVGAGESHVGPERHIVQFYQDDRDLVSQATRFLAAGLRDGEVVIVVATPPHRAAFDLAIGRMGVDLGSLLALGHYVALDAGEMLSAVASDGQPDARRFNERVGALIDRASATGRPVRVYGEMVAIMWQRGELLGAIRLEALWNEMGAHRPFSLYCAYPLAAIANAENLITTKRVCDQHSTLVTPTNYPVLRSEPTVPGGDAECSSFFVPVPLATQAVRSFVVDALTTWHRADLVEDVSLVVSELASNALVHASSPFRVSIQQRESVVRLAVHDTSDVPPVQRRGPAELPGGRGMGIVSALSRSWGCDPVADGKVVWAELDKPSVEL